MSGQTAPNKFSLKTKIGVGALIVAVILTGMLYDPIIYIRVVAVGTAVVAVAFPLVYMTLPWQETLLGKALMTKARAVALLYVASIVGFWWDYPGKVYIMSIVTTYLAIAIGFQFIVLLRIKYEAGMERAYQKEISHERA